MVAIRLDAPDTLTLVFETDSEIPRMLVFPGLVDIQIDGPIYPGESVTGWEVMDLWMLVGAAHRSDGCFVYFLDLPSGGICFASRPGADVIG